MKDKKPKIISSRGFTLLEALIGFMILSIGMLGIASLQAISLKAGKTSVYGSVAMMKVNELLESMRVNPTVSALAEYAAAGSGVGKNNNCTGTVTGNAATLVQYVIYWWNKNLSAGLPAATTTSITYVAAAVASPSKMAKVTINVNWNERNKTAGGSVARTYTTTATICTNIPC